MRESGNTLAFMLGMRAYTIIHLDRYSCYHNMKYRRHSHSITNMNFHIILCSKYRKPYLHKVQSKLMISCFRRSCVKYGCDLVEIEIMPDHIHMFVSVLQPKQFQISRFMNHLKGATSYEIRSKNSWMKRYKAFWSKSYFCESIGNISEPTIRKYIKNQKVELKPNYKYKHIVQSAVNRYKHMPNIQCNNGRRQSATDSSQNVSKFNFAQTKLFSISPTTSNVKRIQTSL